MRMIRDRGLVKKLRGKILLVFFRSVGVVAGSNRTVLKGVGISGKFDQYFSGVSTFQLISEKHAVHMIITNQTIGLSRNFP